jgi:hypothetical protein
MSEQKKVQTTDEIWDNAMLPIALEIVVIGFGIWEMKIWLFVLGVVSLCFVLGLTAHRAGKSTRKESRTNQ